jgi:PST family polysaccharide transporter
MGNEKTESHLVWRGAAILTGAALLVKIMSALYRLPYQNLAGDVGFYVYQQVYPFYALAVALGGTGFPIVISKYMAEADERIEMKASVQRHALIALLFLCGLFFVVLFFFARPLTAMIGDRHLTGLVRVAATVYLFVPLVALLRGNFQGDKENMLPTALSQISEQAARVCFILAASWYLFVNQGDAYQFGAAATSGSALAPLVTIAVLIFFLPRKRAFVRELFSFSLAVDWRLVGTLMISGCLFSILAVPLLPFQLLDSLTVLRFLDKLHLADPRAEKGIYDRAYILTQFGMIAATSLTAAIVPRLAQLASIKKHHDFQIEATLVIKVSLALGAAAATGLMMISREVNIMLFRNALGTTAFAIAALTMLTLSLLLTASGILEATGKPWIPFYFLIIGTGVKGIGNYLLIPHFSIVGAAIATCAGTAAATGLSLFYLRQGALMKRLGWLIVIKLATAIMGMSLTVLLCKMVIGNFTKSLPTRPAAAVIALSGAVFGGIAFIALLYVVRFLDAHDVKRLPIPRHKRRGLPSSKQV